MPTGEEQDKRFAALQRQLPQLSADEDVDLDPLDSHARAEVGLSSAARVDAAYVYTCIDCMLASIGLILSDEVGHICG